MSAELWALPLDDPRWRRLRKAYSPPAAFLPLLAELDADPQKASRIAELFGDENHVCHQFGTSEVTVAVVPHFVRAAGRVSTPNRARILIEVGYYATLLGVPFPTGSKHIRPDTQIRDAYDAAIRTAAALFAEVLTLPCDESEAVARWAAMAGLQGHTRLARVLFKQRIDGCQVCPRCECEFDPLAEWGRGF